MRLVSGQRTATFESSFHLIVSLPHGRQVTSQPGNQDGRDQGERNLPEMQDAELHNVIHQIKDTYQVKDMYLI